jgi:hypothetical protein
MFHEMSNSSRMVKLVFGKIPNDNNSIIMRTFMAIIIEYGTSTNLYLLL